MADNKKSFILYTDIIHIFNELTDDEAGKLIKHLLAYVNDQEPETENRIIKIAFEPIKRQLKRDLKHWESIINKRSAAGKLGGLAKASKGKQSLANLAVTVNDTVTVTDTVILKENKKEKENLLETFFQDLANSSELESISRVQGIPIELLRQQIPLFRKHAELNYPTFQKFTNHFKNWVKLNPPKDPEKPRMVY